MLQTAEIQYAEIPAKSVEVRILGMERVELRKTEKIRMMDPGDAIEITERERATYLHTANMSRYKENARFTTRKQPDGRVLLIRLS